MKLSIMLLMLFVPIVYAEQYLCISNQAAGVFFNKEKSKWEPNIFKEGRKFLVRQPIDNDQVLSRDKVGPYKYVVLPFGKRFTIAECYSGFRKFERTVVQDEKKGEVIFRAFDIINCAGGLGYNFKFDRLSGRFTLAYLGGHTVPTYEGYSGEKTADSPSVEIGKCSQI